MASAAKTLRIRVGTELDSMVVCNPNDELHPIKISSDRFEGYFLIRINNFEGVVPEGASLIPTCPYFDGRRRLMSFQFQGRFKQPWTANDLVWSSDWERPLKVPKMMGIFTKFWSMTDPGSFSDLKSDTPFMRSYVATAMCTLASWPPTSDDSKTEPFVPELVENAGSLFPEIPASAISAPPPRTTSSTSINSNPGSSPSTPPPPARKFVPARGASLAAPMATEAAPTRDWKLIARAKKGGEEAVKDRRKFFSDEENRREAIFHPSKVYGFEVFNPYFDPNTFKIKIPACTIDMKKMMAGQPMRTRLMTEDGSTVFFIVEVSQEILAGEADDTDE